ncbi:unnamed protein product [Paramecium octaurelia]|uniref:GB1/RHD3-type G domain-containing protein n=1 Tax=Paramecium octaurelia TaxID=43137 RepID=A0A8S1Y6X7_PAROT|nr:unnamed protein product [Paramecium octaurelia]
MQQELAQPILFIDIDEDGKFLMSKKAVQFIQAIETNIAIISIVGQYRTGKSYLLNRFAGQQTGFTLGSSTNPCTKGIWIWGKRVESDNLTILLLDTEGLNSYERDQNNDARLLVLACLISSNLLYNVMQVIDEKSLETLSFTTNISKHLLGDDEFITQYLPSLTWVIRDFGLDLQGSTPNTYLEECLDEQQGFADEFKQRNQIRQAITKYFKRRNCYTLVRPVADERQLRELDKVAYSELRYEFKIQLNQLIQNTLLDIQPKMYKNTPLNGKRLIELVTQYVTTINNGSVPNIENVWDRILSKEFNKMMEKAKEILSSDISLPTTYELLFSNLHQVSTKAQESILHYHIAPDRQIEGIVQLSKSITEKSQVLFQENYIKSKRTNQVISNKMYDILNQLSEQGKLVNVQHIIAQVNNIKKIYFQEAKPPSNYECYVQFLELVMQIIEKVANTMQMNFQRKEEDYKQEVNVLKSQINTLQEILKNEKENLHKQLDQVKITLQEERIMYEKKLLELDNSGGIEFRKGELFENPDLFMKKELKNQQLQSQQTFNLTLKDINQKFMDLKEKLDDIYEARVEIERDKIYNKAMYDCKEQNQAQIDRIKLTYEGEVKILKEDRQRLQEQRELLQIQLTQKDCEFQILKERLKQIEKQKTKDIEHADMLCKISDQLVKALKKLEKKKL